MERGREETGRVAAARIESVAREVERAVVAAVEAAGVAGIRIGQRDAARTIGLPLPLGPKRKSVEVTAIAVTGIETAAIEKKEIKEMTARSIERTRKGLETTKTRKRTNHLLAAEKAQEINQRTRQIKKEDTIRKKARKMQMWKASQGAQVVPLESLLLPSPLKQMARTMERPKRESDPQGKRPPLPLKALIAQLVPPKPRSTPLLHARPFLHNKR